MRVTGFCFTHPSREARLRCRSCRKWLCDRCVHVISGNIYCGSACRFKSLYTRILNRIKALSRHQVHLAWTISIVSAAAALLLASVGTHLATLVEISTPQSPANADLSVKGTLREHDSGWILDIDGPPNGSVLVAINDGTLKLVTLDDHGEAALDNVELNASTKIDLIALSHSLSSVNIPSVTPLAAAPSPTPSHTPPTTSRTQARAAAGAIAQPTAPPQPTSTTPRPRARRSFPSAPPILHLVNDAGPVIALTFDGGSSSNGVTDLLAVMSENEMKVTLFLTGQFIEREPSLVRQAVLAGHEVGNHTFSHRHLTTYESNRRHETLPDLDRETFESEMKRTEQAFLRATGKAMAPLWRSPFGEENPEIRSWAMDLGYLHVRWSSLEGKSLDSRDWIEDEHSSLYQEPAQMMKRLLSFPHLEGGIVLMHLASDRITPPWSRLPMFLKELDRQEITPIKVTTMLERSPTWRRWLEKARKQHHKVWKR